MAWLAIGKPMMPIFGIEGIKDKPPRVLRAYSAAS
jgi:hypothetical protein